VREGWQSAHIGEICDVFTGPFGSLLHQSDYISNGAPLINPVNIVNGEILVGSEKTVSRETLNRLRGYVLSKGDIVIGRRGEIGRCAVVGSDQDGWLCGTGCFFIRKSENFDSRFLAELLGAPPYRQRLELAATGTTMKNLSNRALQDLTVMLPPLAEQRRIVAILDEAFAGLSTAANNAEKNLKNSRELFESYAESVFAKTRRGWASRKIGDVARLSRGHNPPKSKFSPVQKYGYVRFYQIRDGKTDDYAVYVPDSPQLHKVEPDDILMVAYRHIGRAFRGASGAFNVALCKIANQDRNILNDDFLFYIIPTSLVRGELLKRAERSLIPSMSVEHLRDIAIPVPPIDEQERIVAEIGLLEEAVRQLEAVYQQKLDEFARLKQSILQKAFSGELTSPPQAIKEAAE
jgi:restriction endonuclease S subunit